MTVDHIYTGFKDEELIILQQFQNDRPGAEPGFISDFIGTIGARTPAESEKLLALERCLSRLPADRLQPRAQPAFQ